MDTPERYWMFYPWKETFPRPEAVRSHFSHLTAAVAAEVKQHILEIHRTGEPQDKKERVVILDTAAAASMTSILASFPFSVVSVGSEGEKEKRNDKLGMEVPTVLGRFGAINNNGEVWMVNDSVEGTTAAANNVPGALSIVAVSSSHGLMPTPEGIHYMDKLFAPPKAAGKVSIDQPPRRNFMAVCDAYGVGPDKVTVVVMDRPRNEHIIQELQAFGAKLNLIKAGDLVPSILAILPPESHNKGIHMLLGIGGWEEGVIAATAARAMGGVAEGRIWEEDRPMGERMRVRDLVPGKPEHSMVIYSAITDDPWFEIGGAEVTDTHVQIGTLVFSSRQSQPQLLVHKIPHQSLT